MFTPVNLNVPEAGAELVVDEALVVAVVPEALDVVEVVVVPAVPGRH
jgi:hypothetical protein